MELSRGSAFSRLWWWRRYGKISCGFDERVFGEVFVVLGYDGLRFAQRSQPPLDLKVFISSGAFYNSPFFYEQFEFSRSFFVSITNFIRSRREVDTTGGEPIMLYNTLVTCFLTLCKSSHIRICQNARDG